MLRRRQVAARALLATVLAAALVGCAAEADPGTLPDVPNPSRPTVAGLDVYVAMGDSYTAAPLFPLKDDQVIDDCLRSDSNYPTRVANHLGIEVVDVSCSGASTVNIFNEQKFASQTEPAQLDALPRDADLITLGIGANDFTFFSNMIFDCLKIADTDIAGAPCRDSNTDAAGRDRLRRNANKIRANVARVVTAISERAPQARIVLIGYPQIIPDEGICRDRLPLATGDYAYTRDLNLRLARAVRDGGREAGAEYVDLVAASQGHDICSDEPWIAGIKGKDNKAAGLHPYPAEQEAVAGLVIGRL